MRNSIESLISPLIGAFEPHFPQFNNYLNKHNLILASFRHIVLLVKRCSIPTPASVGKPYKIKSMILSSLLGNSTLDL